MLFLTKKGEDLANDVKYIPSKLKNELNISENETKAFAKELTNILKHLLEDREEDER